MHESLWNQLQGTLVLVRETDQIEYYIIVKHIENGNFLIAEYGNPSNNKIRNEKFLTIAKDEDQPVNLDMKPYLEAVGE